MLPLRVPVKVLPKKSGGTRTVVLQPPYLAALYRQQIQKYCVRLFRDSVNPHAPDVRLTSYLYGVPACGGAEANARKHAGHRFILTLDLASYFDSVPAHVPSYLDKLFPGCAEMELVLLDDYSAQGGWDCFACRQLYDVPFTFKTNAYRALDLWLRDYVLHAVEPIMGESLAFTWLHIILDFCAYIAPSPTGGVLQGLSISPTLAVLGGLRMDAAILREAAQRKLTYTRYIDDLTISGDDRDAVAEMRHVVERAASEEGFTVHPHKIHLYDANYFRAHVTGFTVGLGSRVSWRRELRQRARAAVRALFEFAAYLRARARADGWTRQRLIRRIRAKYPWIHSVRSYARMLADDSAGSANEEVRARARAAATLADDLIHYYRREAWQRLFGAEP